MKSTTKQWIFFLALPIYTLLGAFLLQRIIYVYLNGLISEMLGDTDGIAPRHSQTSF